MELANATPLAARAWTFDPGLGDGRREGFVVAKASFAYTPDGAVSLDTQSPSPLFIEDQPTPWGLIPRDDLPRGDDGFEVIFLGAAHAPHGRPVTELTVSLSVGEVSRALAVIGHRVATDDVISAPAPFTTMPLGWESAFGGACEVLLDRDAPVFLCDPRNPAGKGFDPRPQARALAAQLRCPEGYPVLSHEPRALPNVEHPARRISRADDAPEPVSWATLPLTRPAHAARALDLDATSRAGLPVASARAFHRAVDEWIITPPPEGATVALRNLDPAGGVRFALPALRVACDFLVGESATSVELLPEALVLMGAWRRFTLRYRARFHYWEREGEAASARLWTRAMGANR